MIYSYFLAITLFICIPNSVVPSSDSKKNACSKWGSYLALNLHVPDKNCYHDSVVSAKGNTVTLIAISGFQSEAHTVTTPDGYIITIFRILSSSGQPNTGPPVYLQHGILMDSSAFIYANERSLAYNLSHANYDVWLGNVRTSQYGRKNLNFNDNDPKFWNFNLDTMQANDLNSALKLVAQVTGQPGEIIYVGHSMGTTLMFMYLADNPQQNLVKAYFALSPVVYVEDKLISVLVKLLPVNLIADVLKLLRINSLLKNVHSIRNLLSIVCRVVPRLCVFLLIDLSLGHSDLFVPEFVPEYFTNWPDAISSQQLVQFGQLIKTDKLSKYDYGSSKNQKVYGSKEPPVYDLSKITTPTFLFYGKNDQLVSEQAVKKIYTELSSTSKDWKQIPVNNKNPKEQFGHVQMIQTIKQELLFDTLHQYLNTV